VTRVVAVETVAQILAEDLGDTVAEVEAAGALIGDPATDPEELDLALARYLTQTERLAEAGQALEVPALEALGRWLGENTEMLAVAEPRVEARTTLTAWPTALVNLLASSGETRSVAQLGSALGDPLWPSPMHEPERRQVLEGLMFLARGRARQAADALRPTDPAGETEAEIRAVREAPAQVSGGGLPDALATGIEPVARPPRDGDPHRELREPLQIAPSPDTHPELLEAFFIEAPEEAGLLAALLRRVGSGDQDSELLRRANRHAHTLKSTAALVGISAVSELSHCLEDVLEAMGALPPEPDLGGLLVEAADQMESMFDLIREGIDRVPDELFAILARIREWVGRLPRPEELQPVAAPARVAGAGTRISEIPLVPPEQVLAQGRTLASHLRQIDENDRAGEVRVAALALARDLRSSAQSLGWDSLAYLVEMLGGVLEVAGEGAHETGLQSLLARAASALESLDAASAGQIATDSLTEALGAWRQGIASKGIQAPPQPPADAPRTAPDIADTHRVPTALLDDLLRLSGELATGMGQIGGRIQAMLDQTESLNRVNQAVRHRLDDLTALSSLQRTSNAFGVPTFRPAEGASVAVGDFDPLEMDEYHEIHGLTSAFAEVLTDARELAVGLTNSLRHASGLVRAQEQVGRDLSTAVLRARMEPASRLTQRLERAVREAARFLGKQVDVSIEGSELPIDTDILNGLRDPLIHLLRNAVDHGIELPVERVRQGKPERGRIRVTYTREGSVILVVVEDDGAGLDVEAIRRKAIAQGLANDSTPLTAKDLERLILTPGFSTRNEVTRLSGRGVGLDVVASAVESLRGSVEIDNRPGAGLAFRLRLPPARIGVPVLLARAGGQAFALPTDQLTALLYAEPGTLADTPGGRVFRHGGETYPLKGLGELLGRPTEDRPIGELKGMPVAMARDGQNLAALALDEMVATREVVVEPLGPWLPNIPGVSGACILADASVAPVLEIPALLRGHARDRAGRSLPAPVTDATIEDVSARLEQPPLVLVVDDSLSGRRALETAMKSAGLQTITAIDGLDAIAAIEDVRPDLVLVDLEMPRMNGLEFTAHLRAAPETAELPVIVVTSRSTAKHREQARLAGAQDYVTKPFDSADIVSRVRNLLARP